MQHPIHIKLKILICSAYSYLRINLATPQKVKIIHPRLSKASHINLTLHIIFNEGKRTENIDIAYEKHNSNIAYIKDVDMGSKSEIPMQ